MEAAPLRCEAMVAELSERLWMVWERMLTDLMRMSNWEMLAASSSSLLVMLPCGLLLETRRLGMVVGHQLRQSMVKTCPLWSGTKCTPPRPRPDASQSPWVAGEESGTISEISIGRKHTSSTSRVKSCKEACMGGVSLTLCPSPDFKASWRTEKEADGHPDGQGHRE
jgi:hypothetical protein